MAIHHAVSDGPGCDGFLSTWAERSAAIASGTPAAPAEKHFSIQGSALNVATPSQERIEELMDQYPVLKNREGPMVPPPPGFKMPDLVPQMWHFPKSRTQALKASITSALKAREASAEVAESWVSTYDSIMALLWSSITRAKLPMLHPDLDSEISLVHAVDTRKVRNPPLPERFLGVGAAAARCKPLAIKDAISPENLADLAAVVRASINSLTPEYLTGMLQWVAGHSDKRWLDINVNSFLGMDLTASSWQSLSAYEKHDFGFGLPKALRWPNPAFEGFVFLYPSRAAMKDPAADEGVEVCVCLEKTCQERLMRDEMLLAYAQPRGL